MDNLFGGVLRFYLTANVHDLDQMPSNEDLIKAIDKLVADCEAKDANMAIQRKNVGNKPTRVKRHACFKSPNSPLAGLHKK